MNGCQYNQRTFTLPASEKTSQVKWDMCFLSLKEFLAKYGYEKPDGRDN